jgi:Dihydrodipicolinate synthase/N-acetylneuraminate lyase
MKRVLKGIVCANITPFEENGSVDYFSVKKLARYLADSGLDAVYPLGTNGEGLALSIEEREKISEIMVNEINGKIPVAIQCGTQTLRDTMKLVLHAKHCGADAAGVVSPFFFHQNLSAIEAYYDEILKAAGEFPVYIYNIPSHTNNDVMPDVVARLAEKHANLAGVKYSHPDIMRLCEYIAIKPQGFDTLIGCDKLIYPAYSVGAVGTVSGPAAVFYELFIALRNAIEQGKTQEALMLQNIVRENDDALAKYQSIPLLKIYLKSIGVIDSAANRIPFLEISQQDETEILKGIAACKENYQKKEACAL